MTDSAPSRPGKRERLIESATGLFHEQGVRVYDTHALEARCRCSRERIEGILRAFPPDELDDMRKEGVTTVTCEFCNTRYVFDQADLDRLSPSPS